MQGTITMTVMPGYRCTGCGHVYAAETGHAERKKPVCSKCRRTGGSIERGSVPALKCPCGRVWRPRESTIKRGTIKCRGCSNTGPMPAGNYNVITPDA